MNGLMPLLLMWLWSQRGGVVPSAPSAPMWPTAASPPPPVPAFQSQPPPVHPSADTGTPLASLHAAPPTPKPASKGVSPASVLRSANSARDAASRAAHALNLNIKSPFGRSSPAPGQHVVTDLQSILINHGAKIAKDGLYGPKTASAWQTLARSKGLPTTFARVGPHTARVDPQTFDQLSVPPIP